MCKQFDELHGNSSTAGKPSTAPHNPSGSTAGASRTCDASPICPVQEALAKVKSNYTSPKGEEYIAFGASFLRPPMPGDHALMSPLMTAEMRLHLLSLWDRCEAAMVVVRQSPTVELSEDCLDAVELFGPLATSFQRLLRTAATYRREIEADRAKYEAKGAPTEEELVATYEESQFRARKELGEPVMFHDGHLRFAESIFQAGYLPGPYPGLWGYTRDGEMVNPKELAAWLSKTEAQRKGQRGVGFLGCPDCKLHAADMVWLYGNQCGTHGPDSYYQHIRQGGAQPLVHVLSSALVRGTMLAGAPLPCMAQD